MEAKLQNSLYKIELHWIKIIPTVLCLLSFLDTMLAYLDIDAPILSYLTALLVWIFLYLSSFCFKFCRWHRVFLYYLLIEGIINWYDYTYIISLELRPMIAIQLSLAAIFLFIGLYLYKHDKFPRKRNCGKAPTPIR